VDIILLPVLSRTYTPFTALLLMKESRRSAAAVLGSPPQGLITSLEVRKAKNQERTNLQEAALEPLMVLFDGDFIHEGYAALKLPDTAFATVRQHLLQTFPGMAHRQLNISYPEVTAFEQILPPGAAQGFLGYDRGAAVVITSHEGGAQVYNGPPPDCCCLNPQTPHDYPAGGKRTGDPCDNCKYKVEC